MTAYDFTHSLNFNRMTMPTHCHNCRRPLSLAELASIESDPRVAEVVRYFGQAACNACCGKAAAHGAEYQA